jgi:carbamoyl-phosphate synthase small subunit
MTDHARTPNLSDAATGAETRPAIGGNRPAARLILEDGSLFRGKAFGAVGWASERGPVAAEVVFNTAMCGYQESLTDPSYAGQILVETFPMIGNYGVNVEDVESSKVHVAGFVVRELARQHSNYRATDDLSAYLAEAGVLGIEGVDTRAITRLLRTNGVMRGIITDDATMSDAELLARVQASPTMAGRNLVKGVGSTGESAWDETLGDWRQLEPDEVRRAGGSRERATLHVLALDCGAKRNILRHLTERGCTVTVVPHTITAKEVADLRAKGKADGLFVSNGPGDPAAVEATIATLRTLIGPDAIDPIPTFGICLGHQLLCLALGATSFKLKFGHRGANQPVLNTLTQEVEITSQNHGFAIDADSLKAVGGEATHVNLNDQTLAGFRLVNRPLFAVQHHPEASPGPHDAGYLFDAFITMMRTGKAPSRESMCRSRAALV